MRPSDFLRDQFQLYRLWILERTARRVRDPEASGRTADMQVQFLDRHARRDWVCKHASDADWPQFRTALQHGHDLVVASRQGRALGWAWIGYERVFLPPLGREIRLPEGTAYLYESYVRPSERGRGVGKRLVAARCRHADGLGLERLLTHVVAGNQASLRALQSHDFRIVGRTHFLRALVLRIWTRAPLPVSTVG
ncbi:MAG: GNAT family N-acetyltransferase [Candidatus Krumholzibacteriia bacterium]